MNDLTLQLWAALTLGLVGSLHCAGMCGPLALALPRVGHTRHAFVTGRILYNLGRITTYCAIGLVFGLFGKSLALSGLQKWLSLTLGGLILLTLTGLTLKPLNASGWKLFALVRKAFGAVLQRRSLSALFALGVVNGLLPCGLVYVAAAGAAVAGSLTGSIAAMAAFGFGTLPVMLAIPFLGPHAPVLSRVQPRRLLPAMVALIGVLLVLRGMELGIPYLSPILAPSDAPACH